MKTLFIPLVFAGIAVGCSGDVLGPPGDISLLSRSRACQAVRFESVTGPVAPGVFVGTVTGNLVGDITTVFPQPAIVHGKASLNDGIDFIEVSGGAFPGLIDMTLELRHDNMAVFAPGRLAFALIPVNGHGTLVEPDGVSGHLNFHGSIDLTAFPVVTLTYRGNICIR